MTEQRVALVVGASRGIGRTIAIDLAKNGYAVAVAAKTTSDASKADPFPPDPNSPQSTISTVVREIKEAGRDAVAIPVDTRNIGSIQAMVQSTVKELGRIDVVVYNSGAIWWSSVANTPHKRFQLMQQVNVEGLYGTVQACLPQFAKQTPANNARIVVVSPPIYSRFFRGKTAYAIGKVGMSVLTKGLAMDFEREEKHGMAITSIWPASAIESGATRDVPEQRRQHLRMASIFSTAILEILKASPAAVNGQLVTDEDFLRDVAGYTEAQIGAFNLVRGSSPRRIMPLKFPDLTVEEQDDEGDRMDSSDIRRQQNETRAAKL